MNNDGLYKVRLFLINIGKILPFVICFVVLISYAECLASILTNNYLAYDGAIVLNKPISWALGLVFEYNVQLLFVVTILAFAIHTCITNKLAIAYLYVNLYEKHYFINTEFSEEIAMIVAIINFLVCLYFVHKGFDIYIYNKKNK